MAALPASMATERAGGGATGTRAVFARRRPQWFAMGVAMAVLVALYGAWQISGWPAGARTLTGDLFAVPFDLAAILGAWVAARRQPRRSRLRAGWSWLLAAMASYLAGDIAWTIYESAGSFPYPSAADVFYLAFYPLMLGGLLRFAPRGLHGAALARMALDLAIVAIGGSAIVLYVWLGPTVVASSPNGIQTAISVAYPVGDVVLLAGLASLAVRRSSPTTLPALGFLASGLVGWVAADLIYGYMTLHGSYRGGDPVDTLWYVAMALFALAGAAQLGPSGASGADAEPPAFCLRTRTMTGVEALLRWRHPTRGVIGPETFVPLSERTSLIAPIGRWVLDTACAQAARWHAAGHALTVAVNVSACALDDDRVVEDVRGALAASGIDPARLMLEITETALMRDAEATAARLRQLKALGVRIAIDDFGNGYSSLAYLREFAVDQIKIDRSFVAGVAGSRHCPALVHTLIELAKTLGLETLGEGIENEAQLRALEQEGCDLGQGFLFAHPVAAEAVGEFLAPADGYQPSTNGSAGGASERLTHTLL